MVEEPHTEDCQGCVADRLTNADRAYLKARGWTHPGHTYRMPAEMPPRPRRRHAPAGAVLICWAVFALAGIQLIEVAFGALVVVAVIAVVALWLLATHHRHHRKHSHLDEQSCRWCTREAARIWAHYDEMTDRQTRRAQYNDYQRLQKSERRYDPESSQ